MFTAFQAGDRLRCLLLAFSGSPSSCVVWLLVRKETLGGRQSSKLTAFSLNEFNAAYFAIDWEELPENVLLPFGGISSGFALAFSKKFHLQRVEHSCPVYITGSGSGSAWPPLAFVLLLILKLLVLGDLHLLLQIGFVKAVFIQEEELVCFFLLPCHEAEINGRT